LKWDIGPNSIGKGVPSTKTPASDLIRAPGR
jgi:hypothetical protein